jgi:hypothetical protein
MALVSDNPVRKAAVAAGTISLLANLIASSILFWQLGKFDAGDSMVILAIGVLFAGVLGGLSFVVGRFLVDWPVYIAYGVAATAGIVYFWLWYFFAGYFIFGRILEHLSIWPVQGWLSGSTAGMISLVTFLTYFKKSRLQRIQSDLICLVTAITITVCLTVSASLYYFGKFILP